MFICSYYRCGVELCYVWFLEIFKEGGFIIFMVQEELKGRNVCQGILKIFQKVKEKKKLSKVGIFIGDIIVFFLVILVGYIVIL